MSLEYDQLVADTKAQTEPVAVELSDYDQLVAETKAMSSTPESGMDDYDQLVANTKLGYTPDTGPVTTQATRQSLFDAGQDAGQGNIFKGAAFLADVFGWEDGEKYLSEMSQQNLNDSQVDREGVWEDVVYAAGQAVPTIGAALTGAIVAPFIGLSGAVGAGIAGFAASWGMNAGDFLSKEEQENPDYVPTAKDLAIPTLMAGMDLIPGAPLARGMKILSPLAETVADTAVNTATKNGVGLVGKIGDFGKEAAKAAVQGGVTEAAQDLTGSLGAVAMTGSTLTSEKIDSFARAAAYEGLIGGILGVPLGGVSSVSNQIAEAQQRFDEDYVAVEGINLQDEEGKINQDFKDLAGKSEKNRKVEEGEALVEGAVKQPGFFSRVFAPVMGNATDRVKQRLYRTPMGKALFNNFAVDRRDRTVGQFTINEKAKSVQGELLTPVQTFVKVDKETAWQAFFNKAKGLDPSNDAERALSETLDEIAPTIYKRVTRGKGKDIMDSLFGDKTYLPIQGMMDWKSMSENSDSVLTTAYQDMVNNGVNGKQIAATMKTLEDMMASYKKSGDPLMDAKNDKTGAIQDSISQTVKSMSESKKKLTRKQRNTIKNRLLKEPKQYTKQGVLTLDRSLGSLSQEWLTNNFDKKADPRQAIQAHIHQFAEQAALIDTFGIDNHLFDEAVVDLALEQASLGDHLDASDINRMYDVLRTQQRIHLNPRKNEAVRNAQNKVRAVLNMKLLGLSALVSIPEALVIFMNHGGKAALTGLVQTVMKGASPVGMGLASEQLGYTINGALNQAINRTGQESYEIGNIETAYFKFTGLPYLQHFLTVWAARSSDVEIKRMLVELNGTSLSQTQMKSYKRKIAEAGIDVEQAMVWAAGDNAFDTNSEFFKEQYIPSIISLTHDTIVDPSPIDKPLWMNDERFLLISQLKGFMTVFTNRVMKNWGHKMTASPEGNVQLATKVAPYVAMYIAAQIGMQAVREFAKEGNIDKWEDKEVGDRIWAAFSYLGAMGYFVDTVNALRFNSDPIASAAGPAASVGLKTLGGAVYALEHSDPEETMQAFFRGVMPNMPFMGLIQEAMGVHK